MILIFEGLENYFKIPYDHFMATPFYSQTFSELKDFCYAQNLRPQIASDLFNWHYKKAVPTPYRHQSLSQDAQRLISERFNFTLLTLAQAHESEDKTVKFLFELSDGKTVEAVLIPFQGKYSLCVSSQVGCAMKCSFCFTGTQGFSRHLKTEEIVGQYLGARHWLKTHRPEDETRILNLVYMGQGEPLNNIEAVAKSSKILLTQNGASFAPHKITVSTVGFLPGLKRWKELMPSVNLALSLHSPFKEKRDELIPLNTRYDLSEILAEIDNLPLEEGRFVTYEYLLVKDFNDSKEDAEALGELLKNKKAYINLIPFNHFPGSIYKRPSDKDVEVFKNKLSDYPIPVTLRKTKGDEILAACGQLKTKKNSSYKNNFSS